jgi:hypothetical protein
MIFISEVQLTHKFNCFIISNILFLYKLVFMFMNSE